MPPAGGESVISRVVRVIDSFDRETTSIPLTSLAKKAKLPVATTYRLVTEMAKFGLLERSANNEIRIGARLWEISSRGSAVQELREAALPHLEDLRSKLRQHVNFAVLDHDSVLFIERLHFEGVIKAARQAERFATHASSPGLVLLAYSSADYQDLVLSRPLARVTDETVVDPKLLRKQLAEIRQQRFANVPGIGMKDWTGMAVPVFGADGAVVAALSVIYPRGQEQPRVALPALRAAADLISQALG